MAAAQTRVTESREAISKIASTTVIKPASPVSSVEEDKVKQLAEWPYAAGFQTDDEQHEPIELQVTGRIPTYAAGVLYRTGPGNYKLKTDTGATWEADHWFDGLTTVHRFDIKDEGASIKVFYNSRRTVDELVQDIRKTGRLEALNFAQKRDPCQSFFKKVMSTFKSVAARTSLNPSTAQNIGVTLSANMPGIDSQPKASSHSSGIATLITKSDHAFYQKLDPETLEPTGVCNQAVLHPDLKGPLSGAHAKTCPVTGDVFNYNLELGSKAIYRIFQASPATGKTEVLASFEGIGAYIHSMFLTQSTAILCVWTSHYKARGLSLLLNKNVADSIAPLDASKPATWYVVDRTPARRGLVATYTSPAFFAFHSVNAWEEPSMNDLSKTDIIAEVPTFKDLSIIHRLYYENILPKDPSTPSYKASHPNCVQNLTRFRLPAVQLSPTSPARPGKTEIIFSLPSSISPELPVINPRYSTLPSRYTYGVRDTGGSGFLDGLLKVDTETQTAVSWSEQGQTAGEPIFVPAPREEGRELAEDEGVLLSVVLDGFKGHSYLLCLDAQTMRELGRAEVNGVVGFGFHGLHIPKNKVDTYSGGD